MQVKTRVESAWFLLLKLKYDKLLSSSVFNLKVRPYTQVTLVSELATTYALVNVPQFEVPSWQGLPDIAQNIRPTHFEPSFLELNGIL